MQEKTQEKKIPVLREITFNMGKTNCSFKMSDKQGHIEKVNNEK